MTLLVCSSISCGRNRHPYQPPTIDPVWPEIDNYPVWAPDGSRILYCHAGITSIRNGGSYAVNSDSAGLWTINADGTNPRLILHGRGIGPVDWSPDGRWIAFGEEAQIYKAPVVGDSSDASQIEQLTFEGRNFSPTWSRDGAWIAYDSDAESPTGANFIWKMKADGSQKTQLAYPGQGEVRNPDWSPEDNRIAHIRYPGGSSSDIFVMDSSGGNVLRLTSSKATDYGPKFSPDALMIAFYSGYEGDVAVWIVNSDGSNLHRIIAGSQPSWSPDGKKLAFIGSHAGTINDNGTVWVVDVDGTNLRQLTHGPR